MGEADDPRTQPYTPRPLSTNDLVANKNRVLTGRNIPSISLKLQKIYPPQEPTGGRTKLPP